MKVFSNFTSMDMDKEVDVVVKKAMVEELKKTIPDRVKGSMSLDILRWAMDQAESSNPAHRAR